MLQARKLIYSELQLQVGKEIILPLIFKQNQVEQRNPFVSVIETASQDVLLPAEPGVACFLPSAVNGASLWQGGGCSVNRPPRPSSLP